MSSTLDQIVKFDCMMHKVSSVVLGIIGIIILIYFISNTRNKSVMTGKATGILSNVVATSSTVKGKVEYSVVMNVAYTVDKKPMKATINSSNNKYANGESIPILYNPKVPSDIVIASEYISPAKSASIGICFALTCIICCIISFAVASTKWGCRLTAFSNAVSLLDRSNNY